MSASLTSARNAGADVGVADLGAQRGQFVHLDNFDMAAEEGALLGEIGIDVEHPAVVVAHDAHAVVFHRVCHARGLDPLGHLAPARRIVLQHARDLVKRDAGAVEDVGNLRHRAGRAMGEPFAGHLRAVAELVEPRVINRRLGREVEDDDRHLRAPHNRQHGGRQRVGGDVQENQVHIRLPELVPRRERLLWRVHEAEVDDLDARQRQFLRDAREVAFEPLLQARELRPVGVQADAEESDAKLLRRFVHGGTLPDPTRQHHARTDQSFAVSGRL